MRNMLNKVATDLATHWVVGQKDGRVCYFNTITKEKSFDPPNVFRNPDRVAPTHPAEPAAAPFASIVSAGPHTGPFPGRPTFMCTSSDVLPPRAESNDQMLLAEDDILEDDEFLRILSANPSLLSTSPPPASSSANFPAEPKPPMSKSELKKMRNREASERSRLKKQAKLSTLERKIVLLEQANQKLRQDLAVSDAEKRQLSNQVEFLKSLVVSSQQNPP